MFEKWITTHENSSEWRKAKLYRKLAFTCISESYFTFRNAFYKATIGNRSSPLLCEVFMENLEDELEEAGTLPRFWIRNVDDVLAIIKREEAGTILEKLNQAQRNIDFTMEIEKEGEIPFSDLKIIRERRDFEFNIYRKRNQT